MSFLGLRRILGGDMHTASRLKQVMEGVGDTYVGLANGTSHYVTAKVVLCVSTIQVGEEHREFAGKQAGMRSLDDY